MQFISHASCYLISELLLHFDDMYLNCIDNIAAENVNTGVGCLGKCGGKEGPCQWCGPTSMCCTQNKEISKNENNCNGNFGGLKIHECVETPAGGKNSNLLRNIYIYIYI